MSFDVKKSGSGALQNSPFETLFLQEGVYIQCETWNLKLRLTPIIIKEYIIRKPPMYHKGHSKTTLTTIGVIKINIKSIYIVSAICK